MVTRKRPVAKAEASAERSTGAAADVLPRTPRREAKRRKILDTALTLFATQGYHRTTVPDIVRAAGVGHGTFYEYFTNRRDVLLALSREAGERFLARRTQQDPETVAERIRLEILWYLSDEVDALDLTKIWTEAEHFDPEIAEDRRKLRELRTSRIRRAIELAAPPGVDPAMAAVALHALLEGFVYRWYVQGRAPSRPRDVVQAAETLSNLWLGAIGAERVRPPVGGGATAGGRESSRAGRSSRGNGAAPR